MPSYAGVMKAISQVYGVPVRDLHGKGRGTRTTSWARMVSIYILYQTSGRKLAEIAELTGRTTPAVHYAVSTVSKRSEEAKLWWDTHQFLRSAKKPREHPDFIDEVARKLASQSLSAELPGPRVQLGQPVEEGAQLVLPLYDYAGNPL